jgi:hypothetical protein
VINFHRLDMKTKIAYPLIALATLAVVASLAFVFRTAPKVPSTTIVPAERSATGTRPSTLSATSTAVQSCDFTPADVKNVPEGWTAHVFSGPCIGLAFPTKAGGRFVDSGAGGDDWDGDLLYASDGTEAGKENTNLTILDVDEASNDQPDSLRCYGFSMGGFRFCHDNIVNRWAAERKTNYTIYIPSDSLNNEFEPFSPPEWAFAAITTKDKHLFTFQLRDKNGTARKILNEVLGTFTSPSTPR